MVESALSAAAASPPWSDQEVSSFQVPSWSSILVTPPPAQTTGQLIAKCGYLSPLELITSEILAAQRLQLMAFDNRLIIDCFANVINILIWLFSKNDRFRNERSQFIVENTSQWQNQSKAQDCSSRIVACWQIFLTDKALFFQQPFHSAEDTLCLCARSRNTEVLSCWRC